MLFEAFFLTNNATANLHKPMSFCTRMWAYLWFRFLKWHCWVKRYVVYVYLTLTFSWSLKPTFPSKSPQMLDRQACWVFTGECLPALQMQQKAQSQAPDPFLFHPAPCLPASLLWSASPYTGYCPSPTPWIIFTKVSVCPDLPRVVYHMYCPGKMIDSISLYSKLFWPGNKLNHHSIPLGFPCSSGW